MSFIELSSKAAPIVSLNEKYAKRMFYVIGATDDTSTFRAQEPAPASPLDSYYSSNSLLRHSPIIDLVADFAL